MPETDRYRDLTSTEEWLRDRISKLLTTGYLAVLGLASLLLAEGEFASLAACQKDLSLTPCQAAIGLPIVAGVFLFFWALEIGRCQNALGNRVHVTLPISWITYCRTALVAAMICGLTFFGVLTDPDEMSAAQKSSAMSCVDRAQMLCAAARR